MLRLYFLVVVCSIGFGKCAPTTTPPTGSRQIPSVRMLEFMKKYGYIQMDIADSEALYTDKGISDTVKLMQKFGGIEQTGVFDEETLKLTTKPRCGLPDIIKSNRRKRYVLGPGNWEKRNISYFLVNWSPKLGESVVHKYIQKALDQWGGYGRLNFFRKSSQDADILVQFARGDHGDGHPFDGPGRILAHAFYPQEQDALAGDIHFDADEEWIDGSNRKEDEEGTDFYFVALHELGHSLGLAHSPVTNSIMFPYYQDIEENAVPQLGYDDILAMYDLYIRKPLKEDTTMIVNSDSNHFTTVSTTTVPSTTDSFTNWFSTTDKEETVQTSSTTDSSTYQSERPTYKEYPYETSADRDYPYRTVTEQSSISSTSTIEYSTVTYTTNDESVKEQMNYDTTRILPSNSKPSIPDICDGHVDSIASLREELFVFRDTYVWRFRERGTLQPGYPVMLKDMFPTLPSFVQKIDAAYQRPDGNILLFTGDKFWIHDGENFLRGSPEPLTHLGLPEYVTKLDAVQNWQRNKKTYFYAMDRFWRYNETSNKIDPGYPQHMQRWRGVPSYLDAATTWKDGFTYFFRGGLFWKFDNDWLMITDDSPMPTPTYWFGCPEQNNIIMSWFLRDP